MALRSPGSSSAEAPLTWDIVDHRSDLYPDIIALRERAYGAAGKLGSGSAAMTDAFDERSRILVAHRTSAPGSRAVVSLRMIHHGAADQWEHEAFIGWPDGLPPRAETVEITRVCVDPGFRDKSMTMELFQRTALDIVMTGKRYFIGSATRNLMPMYHRIGCRELPVSFRYDALGDSEHHLFRADVWAGLHGALSPLSWGLMWAPVLAVWQSSGAYPSAAIPPLWRARAALLGTVKWPLRRLAEVAMARRARRPR